MMLLIVFFRFEIENNMNFVLMASKVDLLKTCRCVVNCGQWSRFAAGHSQK